MQLWPQGAWFGLTRRRVGAVVLSVIAGPVFLFLLTAGYVRYRAHVARQFLEQVQALRLGEPPPPEVIAQFKRHEMKFHFGEENPCTPQDCVYTAVISTFGLSNFEGYGIWPEESAGEVLSALDTEVLNRLGIRYWLVDARLELVNGRAQSYTGDVIVEGPQHRWLHSGWSVASAMPVPLVQAYDDTTIDPSVCAFFVTTHHLSMADGMGAGLYAHLTVQATEQQRRKAFNVDWRCLTKLGGCTTLSEFAPDSARFDGKACARKKPG